MNHDLSHCQVFFGYLRPLGHRAEASEQKGHLLLSGFSSSSEIGFLMKRRFGSDADADFGGGRAEDDRHKWEDSRPRRLHFAVIRLNERADEKKFQPRKKF